MGGAWGAGHPGPCMGELEAPNRSTEKGIAWEKGDLTMMLDRQKLSTGKSHSSGHLGEKPLNLQLWQWGPD